MEYRQLGRTGVKVSPLCLGCMTFGRSTPKEEAYDIVDKAIDAGINFLDTANVYGRGISEEVTGEALKLTMVVFRKGLGTMRMGTSTSPERPDR